MAALLPASPPWLFGDSLSFLLSSSAVLLGDERLPGQISFVFWLSRKRSLCLFPYRSLRQYTLVRGSWRAVLPFLASCGQDQTKAAWCNGIITILVLDAQVLCWRVRSQIWRVGHPKPFLFHDYWRDWCLPAVSPKSVYPISLRSIGSSGFVFPFYSDGNGLDWFQIPHLDAARANFLSPMWTYNQCFKQHPVNHKPREFGVFLFGKAVLRTLCLPFVCSSACTEGLASIASYSGMVQLDFLSGNFGIDFISDHWH